LTCPGHEAIAIVGTLQTQSTGVFDGNGGLQLSSLMLLQAKGIGVDSGEKYSINEVFPTVLNTNGAGLPIVLTQTLRITVNRQGPGGDIHTNAQYRLTIDANGVLRSFIDNVTMVCN
jgi:hypothetical protein